MVQGGRLIFKMLQQYRRITTNTHDNVTLTFVIATELNLQFADIGIAKQLPVDGLQLKRCASLRSVDDISFKTSAIVFTVFLHFA